jgi:hypothetical protein
VLKPSFPFRAVSWGSTLFGGHCRWRTLLTFEVIIDHIFTVRGDEVPELRRHREKRVSDGNDQSSPPVVMVWWQASIGYVRLNSAQNLSGVSNASSHSFSQIETKFGNQGNCERFMNCAEGSNHYEYKATRY